MSIRVMTFVWQCFPKGGSLLLLALAVADIASDDGGRIYPSVDTLAAKIRLSRRNVQYLLRQLENMGWLVVVNNGGGRRRTTRYRMPVETLQRLHPTTDIPRNPDHKRAQRAAENSATAFAHDSLVKHQLTKTLGETATARYSQSGNSTAQTKHINEHLTALKTVLTRKDDKASH